MHILERKSGNASWQGLLFHSLFVWKKPDWITRIPKKKVSWTGRQADRQTCHKQTEWPSNVPETHKSEREREREREREEPAPERKLALHLHPQRPQPPSFLEVLEYRHCKAMTAVQWKTQEKDLSWRWRPHRRCPDGWGAGGTAAWRGPHLGAGRLRSRWCSWVVCYFSSTAVV